MISEIFTHAADLPVQSLRQNDPEAVVPRFFHKAGTGYRIQNRNALAHLLYKQSIHRAVHRYLIFLLMAISGPHNLIHQFSLVCKKKQSF
jgi:hypothetical protein